MPLEMTRRAHPLFAALVGAALLVACAPEGDSASDAPIVLDLGDDTGMGDADPDEADQGEVSDMRADAGPRDVSMPDVVEPDPACIGTECDPTLCAPSNPSGACPPDAICREGACIRVDWEPGPFDAAALARELEAVWAAVDESYAAFGAKALDWDAVRAAYLDRLAQVSSRVEGIWTIVEMVGELGDGHTYAFDPGVCATALPYVQNVSELGACLAEDDGGVYVYDAEPDNRTGLAIGDRIIGIDGRSAEDALRDRMAQPRCTISASSPAMARLAALHSLLYRGRDGETLHIERVVDGRVEAFDRVAMREDSFRRCDGRIEPPGLVGYGAGVRAGPVRGGVFYLWFPFFGSYDADGALVDGPILDALRRAMEDAREARGLVLDLRSNGGGYVSVYTALASWLYSEETPLFGCRNKTGPGPDDFGQPYTLTAVPDPTLTYAGPVAVLVNARTFSAGDFTSGFLGWTGRAAIFGEPSGGGFGSAGAVDPGNGWSVGVNNTECFDLDGTLREGNPPPVDVAVHTTAEAALVGVDSVVEAAIDWLVD